MQEGTINADPTPTGKEVDTATPTAGIDGCREWNGQRPEPTTMLGHTSRPLAHLPEDTNEDIGTLWRYMDYWKYEDLVRTRSLYVCESHSITTSNMETTPLSASAAVTCRWRPVLGTASGCT